jgi:hypothetical protein
MLVEISAFSYSRAMAIRLSLLPHPDTPCDPLTGIQVEVARAGTRTGFRRIALRFVASGNIRAIDFPRGRHPAGPRREDELWRHTCFEAFVRVGESSAYHEFNLSPSRNWACYRFLDYREGMESEKYAGEPGIENDWRWEAPDPQRAEGLALAELDTLERFEAPFYSLTATLDLGRTLLPGDEPWHLGLSAVIEERNGRKSYWALKHPAGAPDFHHADCFALGLPAARPS